jgi:hypothetical protein
VLRNGQPLLQVEYLACQCGAPILQSSERVFVAVRSHALDVGLGNPERSWRQRHNTVFFSLRTPLNFPKSAFWSMNWPVVVQRSVGPWRTETMSR